MALTKENAPQLRPYTLRREGGPLTDILDPDTGVLRITVFPDLPKNNWMSGFDPKSIPAAEALTRRIIAALNFLRDVPTEAFDGMSLNGFVGLIAEKVDRSQLSMPMRQALDRLTKGTMS